MPRRYEPLPEPPVGALIRFVAGRVYNFLAVRQPAGHWETTASDTGYGLRESMTWPQLTRKFKKFDYATAVEPVGPADPRVREDMAAVLYSVAGHRFAAININRDGNSEGWWYTTDDAWIMDWSNLWAVASGQVSLVTTWTQYKARPIRA